MLLFSMKLNAQLIAKGIAPLSFLPTIQRSHVFSSADFIATSTGMSSFGAAIHFEKPVRIEGVRTMFAATHFAIKQLHVVGAARVFGNEQYRKTSIRIGFAKNLGNLSLGIGSTINNTAVQGYSSETSIRGCLSSTIRIVNEVHLVLQIENLGFKAAELPDENAMIIEGGVIYDASSKVNVTAFWSKQRDVPPIATLQVLYVPVEKVAIRLGYVTSINGLNVSVGYTIGKIEISLSMRYDPVFGSMPGITINNQPK